MRGVVCYSVNFQLLTKRKVFSSSAQRYYYLKFISSISKDILPVIF